MERFVLISGCSSGGKSTLLAELSRRGFATVDEPGRRIVKQELEGDGAALPWVNGTAFARRAVAMAQADLSAAALLQGWVFFDRGLIDAAVALEHSSGEPAAGTISAHRFHRQAFLTPPWPEIYVTDAERPHAYEAAVEEYRRLLKAYPALGYEPLVLPKVSVGERADFILKSLAVASD
ncbi:AAA family ATPase [Bradyrhizobium sp. LHD-71]|uniref:AAA family ATPase n=1 Tax=Bradyrhizobium sp. LHD-71 TaxID=3072141 RepID=UPI00280DB25A|nr:AAA family ATPase [Bradyrhizobium sp. LHD-71]MDQ8729992.1 AAA family ATPase [Bradyrhizobium sp. LHD-71]